MAVFPEVIPDSAKRRVASQADITYPYEDIVPNGKGVQPFDTHAEEAWTGVSGDARDV
jgi:hypothetical protein